MAEAADFTEDRATEGDMALSREEEVTATGIEKAEALLLTAKGEAREPAREAATEAHTKGIGHAAHIQGRMKEGLGRVILFVLL